MLQGYLDFFKEDFKKEIQSAIYASISKRNGRKILIE